jgi:Flp pilus assembly protein TadG
MGFLRKDEGSGLIELALCLPLTLLIVFAIVNYAQWIQKAILLQDAAAAGASYGTIPGNSTNHTNMVAVANWNATGSVNGATGFTATANDFYTCSPGGSQVTATSSCPTGAPYHYVQVNTATSVKNFIPWPGIPSTIAIKGQAIYRVEVTP